MFWNSSVRRINDEITKKGESQTRSQHDILVWSLKKVAEDAKGENGGWKINLIIFMGGTSGFVHAQTLNHNLKELQVIESKRNAIRNGLIYEMLNAQDTVLCSYFAQRSGEGMNGKIKAVSRRKYSKGWAILNEAWRRTTRWRKSEGLVGQCKLARELTLAFGVGREVWGMATLGLEVVKLMAEHTTAWLKGLVDLIRGLANPKSGGARRKVHSHPSPV
jgi:hypothetical protein